MDGQDGDIRGRNGWVTYFKGCQSGDALFICALCWVSKRFVSACARISEHRVRMNNRGAEVQVIANHDIYQRYVIYNMPHEQ